MSDNDMVRAKWHEEQMAEAFEMSRRLLQQNDLHWRKQVDAYANFGFMMGSIVGSCTVLAVVIFFKAFG